MTHCQVLCQSKDAFCLLLIFNGQAVAKVARQGVIQVWPDSTQRMILIGISDLLKHNVVTFQGAGQSHSLLIMHVVI